jgi:hypothetical protein
MTYLISYWPSRNDPNPSAVFAALANEIARHPPWVQVSVSTWAVQSDATGDQILTVLENAAPPVTQELLIVAPTGPWAATQHEPGPTIQSVSW